MASPLTRRDRRRTISTPSARRSPSRRQPTTRSRKDLQSSRAGSEESARLVTSRTLSAHGRFAAHPRRPARGRRRPREPALPRLRRAAVRLAGAAARPGGPVSRCESCGLGVVGASGGAEEALRELDRLGDGEALRIANRASFACSLGSAGWAGLGPGARYLFTVESVRRLVARRDQVVKSRRWAPGGEPRDRPGSRCSTASPSATTSPSAPSGAARPAPAEKPLAAADRRPRQRRPGDPGAADRGPVELPAASSSRRGLRLHFELL